MWLVEYSAIAEHYVDSNLPYTVGVVRAVLRLMMSNDGQPTEGVLEALEENRYRWIVAEHELIIRQEANQTVIERVYFQSGDWTHLFRP